ncbi:hypothetical protein H0A61_01865 [Koleobacter methoxysyntrophicus]|uniref:CBS domain-containing protein n=1 Tax=Koleobacter methoxysyntrophicus TaxID=2751313 RepID=A0A8A0RNQ8_9FIRM|nr:CBS domain-containing protein [Koleobacter methoxysyntrophicus]QSQ09494.1 hypothetical protein H0A61_01865 [Koleobacter methoxysyntrophicus]
MIDKRVKEFMNQEIVVISYKRKVKEAKEIMRLKNLTGIPVIDENTGQNHLKSFYPNFNLAFF